MSNNELLLIEANQRKFSGKHYTNKETKTHYMEYKGVIFQFDPDKEVYVFCNYECIGE